MDRSLELSPQQLEVLLPALQDVAEYVQQHGHADKNAWELLLIPSGLNEDWAITELDRWAQVLSRVRGTADDREREMAERGLRRRGIPDAQAVLAVETVAPRERPAPVAASLAEAPHEADWAGFPLPTEPAGEGRPRDEDAGPTLWQAVGERDRARNGRQPVSRAREESLIGSGGAPAPPARPAASRGRLVLSYLAMAGIIIGLVAANWHLLDTRTAIPSPQPPKKSTTAKKSPGAGGSQAPKVASAGHSTSPGPINPAPSPSVILPTPPVVPSPTPVTPEKMVTVLYCPTDHHMWRLTPKTRLFKRCPDDGTLLIQRQVPAHVAAHARTTVF